MNQSVISILKCPVCGAGMQASPDARSIRCEGARTHCYDLSRSGYLNVTSPSDGVGDGKDAVRARTAFLGGGYYAPLSDAVNGILDGRGVSTVLDAGCGEGYYTNRFAEDRTVLGIDLSRAGIDRAAKRAKQSGSGAGFAVASIFEIPVLDASLDAVANIFAPCAEEEFCRVLKPGGYLILVGAGERHLMGLKKALYDNPYANPGRADLPKQMEHIQTLRVRSEITVTGQEMISALFSMTPYYWRTSPKDRAKLDRCEKLTTEIDFDIFLFRKGQL